jgi:hypothetical protein
MSKLYTKKQIVKNLLFIFGEGNHKFTSFNLFLYEKLLNYILLFKNIPFTQYYIAIFILAKINYIIYNQIKSTLRNAVPHCGTKF